MGEEEPAYTFELGSSLAAVWMLVSLVLFVAAAAGTGLLYALLRQSPFESARSLLLWPVAFLAVLPAHELIHAAFVRLFEMSSSSGISAVTPSKEKRLVPR